MRTYDVDGQMSLFAQDGCSGKMSQGPSPAVSPEERISGRSLRKRPEWWTQPAMCLDLRKESGWVLGIFWQTVFPLRGEQSTHSFSEFPRDAEESRLSQILQDFAPLKYYLSKTACRGIIYRAKVRQKPLPGALRQALEIQSGLRPNAFIQAEDLPQAFACNQRDETRDLHSVSAALTAEPGMKAQTFVAGITAKGTGECFLSKDRHTTLGGGGGLPGQGYPCVLAAGFSAGAGASAGSTGYTEELSPTLKGSESGNCMPSVLCLTDQGGSVMDCQRELAGTLRAQEHGHQPLVLYENHGIDSRYTGPHPVAPAMSSWYGTGGNNTPLVGAYAIAATAVGRQPENGGNGIGYSEETGYTLTATDEHCVCQLFSQQRSDHYQDSPVTSTQSARQGKSATDIVLDPAAAGLYIRRLMPIECERLQGFPDNWTAIPGATDSARYRALGNSIAVPCFEFVFKNLAWCHGQKMTLLPADVYSA